MNKDALSTYEPKGNGLYLQIDSRTPAKIRVFTLDPGVVESSGENNSGEQWVSTKYAFIVWNWDEKKAQLWTATPGVLKQLTNIHRDEDLEPLNKVDIKVSATGEMLEKRYSVMPLPTSTEITPAMINEAKQLKIEDIKGYKGRLSEMNDELDGDTHNSYANEEDHSVDESEQDITLQEMDKAMNEPIDLDNIPF